jgi:hypothetical protein
MDTKRSAHDRGQWRSIRNRRRQHRPQFEEFERRIMLSDTPTTFARGHFHAAPLDRPGPRPAATAHVGRPSHASGTAAIPDGIVLSIPSQPGQLVDVSFALLGRESRTRDEVGVFRVDDPSGRIGRLRPGQFGYSTAAIARSRRIRLFSPRQAAGAVTHVALPAGADYGFYLVQDASVAQHLAWGRHAGSRHGSEPHIFFSFPAANFDHVTHVIVDPGNSSVYGFEDTSRDADRDFNDVVVAAAFPLPPGSHAPVVTIATPQAGLLTNRNVSVAGQVSGDASGIKSLQARVDAGPWFDVGLDAGGHYQLATSLALDGSADGIQTVTLRATGNDGLASQPASVSFVLDTQPTTITIDNPSPGVTGTNVTITGHVADALSGVANLQAWVDSGSFSGVSFDSSGAFRLTTTLPLDGSGDGPHVVRFQAADRAGNVSTPVPVAFTLASVPPSAPTLAAASDTGKSNSDGVTSIATPTFTGTAEPNTLVSLLADGVVVGTGTADAAGNWSITSRRLADGVHQMTAAASDAAGDLGAPSAATTVTIDTVPPIVTIGLSEGATVRPGDRLQGTVAGTGSPPEDITFRIDDGPETPGLTHTDTGAFDERLDLTGVRPGPHRLTVTGFDLAGNSATATVDVQAVIPLTLAAVAPADGAVDVGVTFKPKVTFSKPVDPASLNDSNLFLSFSGQKLPARIVPANDGTFAWLFPQAPLPGATRLTLTVDGATIRAADTGEALDATGTGQPGSRLDLAFTTVSVTPVPGTTLVGRIVDPGPDLVPMTADDFNPGPDGKPGTADDVYLRPIAGVKVYIIGLENQAVFTDAEGRFQLDAVPAGDVKVVIDGKTATAPPAGMYFPEMVMDAVMQPQTENLVMPGMETMYLPRLATSLFQPVDASRGATIALDPASAFDLPADQQPYLKLEVPPNSLIGPDGQPVASGQVGISVVPPELVDGMLPPGVLKHTFDITVQAQGFTNFSQPAPLTLPNVFNAAPGTQLNFLSFDHTTGRLVIEGTATVSADGKSVRTDPGTGVTHPGWHGLTPPGGPTCQGPPPVAPLNSIPPVPVIGEDGSIEPLKDHLFFKDSDALALTIRNDAADQRSPSCPQPNETPMKVYLNVEGPVDSFLSGDLSGRNGPGNPLVYTLEPGDHAEVDIRAAALDTPAKLKGATEDVLYGAKVTVETTWEVGPDDERPLETKTFYVYRFWDVADDDHEDGLVDFRRTFVGGGNQQEIPLKLDVPGSAGVPFGNPDNPEFRLETGKFVFEPQSASGSGVVLKMGMIQVLNPETHSPVGAIKLRGLAVSTQELLFPFNPFQAALARLVQTKFDDPAWKEFIDYYGPLNPQFGQHILQSYNAIKSAIEGYFRPVQAQSGNAFVISSEGQGVRIDYSTDPEVDTEICRSQTALACTPSVDFDTAKFKTFVADENSTSLLQKKFEFDSITNRDPSGTMTMLLDREVELVLRERQIQLRFMAPRPLDQIFEQLMSQTIAHEMGHTLGAIHDPNTPMASAPASIPPATIMSYGNPSQVSLRFSSLSRTVFRFALGFPVDDPAFQDAFAKYEAASRLPNFDVLTDDVTSDSNDYRINAPWLVVAGVPVTTSDPLPPSVPSLDLGSTVADGAGGASSSVNLFLFNNGDKDLVIDNVELSRETPGFSIQGIGPFPITIPALDPNHPDLSTRVLTVRFDPATAGPAADVLRITSNSLTGETITIPLFGTGVSASGDLAVEVPKNNAGGVRVHDAPKTLDNFGTLRNIGSQPLSITSIVPDEASIGQFAPTGLPSGFGPGQPLVLQPGDSFTFGLVFSPKLIGLQRGQLRISSDDPNQPVFTLPVVGTGLADTGSALDYGHDFVAVEEPFNPVAPVLRQVSDAKGNWSFFLPPLTHIHYAIFDPVSGLIAQGFATTTVSGQTTILSPPVFVASTAPDRSGDGLPDDVKFAIGISSTSSDPQDFVKVQEGLNPLAGGPLPTGVIASLNLSGVPSKVAVVGNTAYVATSTGLAVVDTTQPTRPRLLSQTDLPGASDVAVDPKLALAAVATGSALAVLDVADPTLPVVRKTIDVTAGHVVIVDGVAYAATTNELHAIDLFTGEELQKLVLPMGGPIRGLAREGTTLYALGSDPTPGSPDILLVIDASHEGSAAVVGQLQDDTLSHFAHVFASNGVVYLSGSSGLATVEAADPTKPYLLAGPQVQFDARGGLAVDGGGLAVIGVPNATGAVNTGVGVFDVTDPSNTGKLLFLVPTAGAPSDLAVGTGMAFVAERGGALDVVNLSTVAPNHKAPTIALSTSAVDLDPDTPGLQVAEGAAIPLRADITSDGPVRNVLLLLNGRPVQDVTAAPFDALSVAPDIATDGTSITLRALVTDRDGSSALSNPIRIGLLPVKVPPAIVSIDPADGSKVPEGRQGIRILVSESLAPATVTGQTFQLQDAGGHTLPVRNLQLRGGGQVVQLAYDPLPPGSYQLVIKAASVTNVAGTPMGASDIVTRFTVAAAPSAATLFPDQRFQPGINSLLVSSVTGLPLVVAADLNGDGRTDLAAASQGDESVWVLLSKGDDTFAKPAVVPLNLPADSVPLRINVIDVNGDGHPDIVSFWRVMANGARTVVAETLFGHGDGTFGSPVGQTIPTLDAFSVSRLALGDVTGDGRPDLVLAGLFLTVWPGKGDGTFGAPVQAGFGGGGGRTAIADVNGDGKPDIVTAESTENSTTFISVYLANGDGTFSPGPRSTVLGSILSMSVVDLTGNGRLSIVAAFQSPQLNGVISVLPLNADGTLGARQDVLVGGLYEPDGVAAVGDVNGDGRLDILVSRPATVTFGANLVVMVQNQDGTFSAQGNFDLPLVSGPGGISDDAYYALADLTGRHRLDLVALDGVTDTGFVLAGDGRGNFAHQVDIPMSARNTGLASLGGDLTGEFPNLDRALALADINGDGHLDILAGSTDSEFMFGKNARITVRLGNGDGTFRAGAEIPLEHSDTVDQGSGFLLADLNGDGKLDLITPTVFNEKDQQKIRGGLSIQLGKGDGTFGPRMDQFADFPERIDVAPLAVGDVNGDGHPDIIAVAWENLSNAGILILFGNGDGTFRLKPGSLLTTQISLPATPGNGPFRGVTLADVNGDGIPDIAFLDTLPDGTATASVILGDRGLDKSQTGAKRIDIPLSPPPHFGRRYLRVGDVDGDGHPDLVVVEDLPDEQGNLTGIRVSVLKGKGDGTFAAPVTSDFRLNRPSSISDMALGDVNGDGHLDIVLANQGSNSATILLGNGDGTFAAPVDYAVGDEPLAIRLGDLDQNGALDLVTAQESFLGVTVSPRLSRLF